MNRRMASLVASLVGLSLLTTTVPSFAQTTKGKPSPVATNKKKPLSKKDPKYLEAKRLFEKGEELYSKGDYEKAIESWELSYDLSEADLILESIANAYERLGQVAKARDFLGRWRDAAPEDEHAALDARLAKLDERLAKEKAAQQSKEAKDKAAKDAQAKRDAEERANKDGGGKLFVPGIVIAGVGAGAAITGGVLDILAYRGRPDPTEVCATSPDGKLLCRESSRTVIDRSNTFATVGDILLFAGTATAAVGVVLVVLKSGKKKDDTKAAATPWFLPGGGGMIVGGSF
jgi:tetratricopeptide (TPR) repeat protein